MRRHMLKIVGLLAVAIVALPHAATAMIDPITRQSLYSDGRITNMRGSEVGTTQARPQPVAMTRRMASPIPKETVAYQTNYAPGTIVVNTTERRLYLVLGNGQALRYGVGVGREGFQWSGSHRVTRKAEWPSWTPPASMLQRQPGLPRHMAGGPNNPMGARGIYIGSTLYRIHGSNEPWTIGSAVSSGCIRMTNEDVIDLYDRVKVGARVVVTR